MPQHSSILPLAFIGLLLAGAGCANAFNEAQTRDTVLAYREFAMANPGAAEVQEARMLEAKAAYRDLGEKPGADDLKHWLSLYAYSPFSAQVHAQLEEILLDTQLATANWPAIRAIAEGADDEAIRERAKAASAHYTGVARAIRDLNADFFKTYLRDNPGGDFVDPSQEDLHWIERLRGKAQAQILVEIDGAVPAKTKKVLADQLRRLGGKVVFVESLKLARIKNGEVAYRLVQFLRDQKFSLYDGAGDTYVATGGRSGYAVQIVLKRKGKLGQIWTGGVTENLGLKGISYPLLTWNTTRAIAGSLRFETGVGQVVGLGKHLVIGGLEGIYILDPSLPHRVRVAGSVAARSTDVRPYLATGGGFVAQYGSGLEIYDCRNLRAIRSVSHIPWGQTSSVRSGVFVGRYFYFAADGGLFRARPGSSDPTMITRTRYSHLVLRNRELVAAGNDGITVYRLDQTGDVADHKDLRLSNDNRDFLAEGVVGSLSQGGSAILVNGQGYVRALSRSKITTSVDEAEVGSVRDLAGGQARMITVGPRGISLLEKTGKGRKKAFRTLGSIPINGCLDVVYQHPYAYASCGDRVLTIHVPGLKRSF